MGYRLSPESRNTMKFMASSPIQIEVKLVTHSLNLECRGILTTHVLGIQWKFFRYLPNHHIIVVKLLLILTLILKRLYGLT